MKVDSVITLANNKNYLLLLENSFNSDNYFLSVLLDSNNEPTDEYIVLKEVKKDGKIYTKKENDPIILSQLLEDYKLQYNDEYEN